MLVTNILLDHRKNKLNGSFNFEGKSKDARKVLLQVTKGMILQDKLVIESGKHILLKQKSPTQQAEIFMSRAINAPLFFLKTHFYKKSIKILDNNWNKLNLQGQSDFVEVHRDLAIHQSSKDLYKDSCETYRTLISKLFDRKSPLLQDEDLTQRLINDMAGFHSEAFFQGDLDNAMKFLKQGTRFIKRLKKEYGVRPDKETVKLIKESMQRIRNCTDPT